MRAPGRFDLRAATSTALLFGLVLVVVETLVIAAWYRNYALSPYSFFGAQLYDHCFKLFLLLPGTDVWLSGGALDRFVADGFTAKFSLAAGLIVPNILVGFFLTLAAEGLRLIAERRMRIPTLAVVVGIALVIHLTSWATAVHIPADRAVRAVIRNAGRVFVWQGTFLALISLFAAGMLTALLERRSRRLRQAVGLSLAGFAGLAVLLASQADTAPASTEPPPPAAANEARVDNVILISIDSLRADRLGAYGNAREVSPTLDRLAAAGARFDSAMTTSSWTLPSHMSMLTGRNVVSHGVITVEDRLPEDGVSTLAEAMRAEGRTTGGIVSCGLLQKRFGFGRGFDHYDDQTIPAVIPDREVKDEPAPQVRDLANRFIRDHANEKFFLFLHFWDVHYDYIPPAPYDSMFDPDYAGTVDGHDFFKDPAINRHMAPRDLEHVLALYDGEIRWVDDHIAEILQTLEEVGIDERTAIIVTADHGEEFFEHGFKGHGRTLYREVMQVPLIIRAPGVGPGLVIDRPASLVDVMPTALDLVGGAIPDQVEGTSLVAAMSAATLARRPGVYGFLCAVKLWSNCQSMQHSSDGTLIHRFQPPEIEFYRPADDQQQSNVADQQGWHRERELTLLVRSLNRQWAGYRGHGGGRGAVAVSDAQKEHLRALGYWDLDPGGAAVPPHTPSSAP